jgi:hypothetical protein
MLLLDARRITEAAQKRHEAAVTKLERRRKATAKALEGLGRAQVLVYDREMRRFAAAFGQIKDADLSALADQRVTGVAEALPASEVRHIAFSAVDGLKAAIAAGGAGAATGAMAFGAAGTLATASTGTAIGTLGGVAAYNATLAWFGGGALAAGGYGMAGGVIVLGGIALAPLLAVGGFVLHRQGKKAMETAKATEAAVWSAVAQLETLGVLANAIKERAQQMQELLEQLRASFEPMVTWLEKLVERESDYRRLDPSEQTGLHVVTATAITVRRVLDVPLLTQAGKVSLKSATVMKQAHQLLAQIKSEAQGTPAANAHS